MAILKEYSCPICNHTDEFFDKSGVWPIHLCPKCLVNCEHYVRVDLNTGEITKASNSYSKSYEDDQVGAYPGKSVPMRRVISVPHIHQKGYAPGDARIGRGTKG